MDCYAVRGLLTLFRHEPRQFDAAEQAALDRHLESCPGCRTWDQNDRHVDSTFAAAMKNVAAPTGLEGRIRDRLAGGRTPRGWGWAAVAACVLLAAGLAGLAAWPRPRLADLPSLLQQAYEQDRAPESVKQYFADLGYPVSLPQELNYDYLRWFELATFQGRPTPRLTFLDRQGRHVNVYILSSATFSLPAAWDGERLPQRGVHQVMARTEPGFIFVYEWIGDALDAIKHAAG